MLIVQVRINVFRLGSALQAVYAPVLKDTPVQIVQSLYVLIMVFSSRTLVFVMLHGAERTVVYLGIVKTDNVVTMESVTLILDVNVLSHGQVLLVKRVDKSTSTKAFISMHELREVDPNGQVVRSFDLGPNKNWSVTTDIIIDPDFSLLTGFTSKDNDIQVHCRGNSSAGGLTKLQIVGVVIGSIAVFVAIIAAIVGFVLRNRQLQREHTKRQLKLQSIMGNQ
eukprot:gene4035-4673_t